MSAIFDPSPEPTPTSSYDADPNNYWSANAYSSQTLSAVEGAALKGASSSANLGRTRSGRLTKKPRNADDNDDGSIEDRKRLSESLSFHEYNESNPIQPLLAIANDTLFALEAAAARQYSGPPSPESQPRQQPEHSRANTNHSDTVAPVALQSPDLGSPSLSPTHLATGPATSTSTHFNHQIFSPSGTPSIPFATGSLIPPRTSSRPPAPGHTPSYQNKSISLAPPPPRDQGLPSGFKAFATDDNDVWTEDSSTCTGAAEMQKQSSGGGDTEVDEEEAAEAAAGQSLLTMSTPSPNIVESQIAPVNTKTSNLKGKGVIPVILSSPKVATRKRGRSASKALFDQSGGEDAEGEQYEEETEQMQGQEQSRASTSQIAVADDEEEVDSDDDDEDDSPPAARFVSPKKRRTRRQSSAPSNSDQSAGLRDPLTGRRIFNGLASNSTQKVDLDAPIQKRQYVGESKTSRKEVPVAMKRVLKKVGKKRGEEVQEKEEVERIVREAREANTKAARLSRERKKAHLEGLQKHNDELSVEVGLWKERAQRAEYELQEWRAGKRRL